MKRIIEDLGRIGKDKWIHFILCFLITQVSFAICHACGLGVAWVFPTFLLGLGAGIAKEVYDSKHGGQFDRFDLAADFIGAWLGVIVLSLMLIPN